MASVAPSAASIAGVEALKRLCAVLALAACTTVPERPAPARQGAVAPFSSAVAGGELPAGWSAWIVDPRKPGTRYSLVEDGGRVVVRAEADSSVSALTHDVAVDPASNPRIRWRWKAERLVAEAQELDLAREDAPARVLVAFSGDAARLEPEERARLALAGALSGREMPYAILMYIWSSRHPAETVLANPRSSRVRMLVVEQGAAGLGRWLEYERDVASDYRRAFGEDAAAIVWIGVMTDTDDTRSSALTYYGDIVLGR